MYCRRQKRCNSGSGSVNIFVMPPVRRVSEEELRLFSDRIVRSLAERPAELAVAAHREEVASLVRRVGEASFYEMLGVDPAAPVLKVHEAYERVARQVHPSNAERLDLTGREGVLNLLFERVTEAYLTLSYTDRRKVYDRESPAAPPPVAVPRADEAHRLFEKARVLAAAEQLHAAVELLREAVRTTPKADYLALLGLLQTRNRLWLRHAEENLRQAIAKGARDPALPAALAEVRKRIESGAMTDDSQEVETL